MVNSDYPKVLVGVVTYDGKDYIFPENYKIISNLSYPNYDFIIVDNSNGKSYTTLLRRRGCRNVNHIERCDNSRATLAKSQNFVRQRAIDGNYDYVMFIESDLLPPLDIIQRLMKHNKPVTGSIYYIGVGQKTPCIFFVDKKPSGLYGTRLLGTKTTESGEVVYDGGVEEKNFIHTGLQRVHGCGFGCTLMRRNIIEKYPFWYDERFTDKHSDVYWYMALSRQGVEVCVDTDIIVPHFPSDWNLVKDR